LFALRFNGRKHVDRADDIVARITADRLLWHLERSGIVTMKRPAPQRHRWVPDPAVIASSASFASVRYRPLVGQWR